MDYFNLWSEYQRLRIKYKTDDISQWSDKDQKRANEIRKITSKLTTDDIYVSMASHVRGERKQTLFRRIIRWLSLWGSK